MKLEIHKPELEELIRKRMASGRFQSVEDALLQALQSLGKRCFSHDRAMLAAGSGGPRLELQRSDILE